MYSNIFYNSPYSNQKIDKRNSFKFDIENKSIDNINFQKEEKQLISNFERESEDKFEKKEEIEGQEALPPSNNVNRLANFFSNLENNNKKSKTKNQQIRHSLDSLQFEKLLQSFEKKRSENQNTTTQQVNTPDYNLGNYCETFLNSLDSNKQNILDIDNKSIHQSIISSLSETSSSSYSSSSPSSSSSSSSSSSPKQEYNSVTLNPIKFPSLINPLDNQHLVSDNFLETPKTPNSAPISPNFVKFEKENKDLVLIEPEEFEACFLTNNLTPQDCTTASSSTDSPSIINHSQESTVNNTVDNYTTENNTTESFNIEIEYSQSLFYKSTKFILITFNSLMRLSPYSDEFTHLIECTEKLDETIREAQEFKHEYYSYLHSLQLQEKQRKSAQSFGSQNLSGKINSIKKTNHINSYNDKYKSNFQPNPYFSFDTYKKIFDLIDLTKEFHQLLLDYIYTTRKNNNIISNNSFVLNFKNDDNLDEQKLEDFENLNGHNETVKPILFFKSTIESFLDLVLPHIMRKNSLNEPCINNSFSSFFSSFSPFQPQDDTSTLTSDSLSSISTVRTTSSSSASIFKAMCCRMSRKYNSDMITIKKYSNEDIEEFKNNYLAYHYYSIASTRIKIILSNLLLKILISTYSIEYYHIKFLNINHYLNQLISIRKKYESNFISAYKFLKKINILIKNKLKSFNKDKNTQNHDENNLIDTNTINLNSSIPSGSNNIGTDSSIDTQSSLRRLSFKYSTEENEELSIINCINSIIKKYASITTFITEINHFLNHHCHLYGDEFMRLSEDNKKLGGLPSDIFNRLEGILDLLHLHSILATDFLYNNLHYDEISNKSTDDRNEYNHYDNQEIEDESSFNKLNSNMIELNNLIMESSIIFSKSHQILDQILTACEAITHTQAQAQLKELYHYYTSLSMKKKEEIKLVQENISKEKFRVRESVKQLKKNEIHNNIGQYCQENNKTHGKLTKFILFN